MKGYVGNIEEQTLENENFRTTLFTGEHIQLVVMTIQPGEEVGLEKHDTHDQFFRIEEGQAKVIMDGEAVEVGPNWAFIVPAGTEHNVVNIGEGTLRFYTLYAPVEHAPGTIHKTKADAALEEGIDK